MTAALTDPQVLETADVTLRGAEGWEQTRFVQVMRAQARDRRRFDAGDLCTVGQQRGDLPRESVGGIPIVVVPLRVFHWALRPILTELGLSCTLDLAASVLGEPEPTMPMQRGGRTCRVASG